jgi:hypothetical protein
MMDSYQTALCDDFRLTRHECGHALHAFLCGSRVRRVVIAESEGYCDLASPLTPGTLAATWAQSPITASIELARILGTLRAGALCDGWREPSGRDAEALEGWHKAYVTHIGSNADWTRLYGHVFERLAVWARHSAARQAIAGLAEILARTGELNEYGWQTALGLVGIDSVPDPYYVAILPVQPPPAQRRVETQPGPRRVEPQTQAVPTTTRATRAIPTETNAAYFVYYLREHDAGSLIRFVDRRTQGEAWAVLGDQGSWEFSDYDAALAKFRALDPALRLALR